MKDVESTESKANLYFSFFRFIFFKFWLFLVIFVQQFFLYPITRKIDISFVSAHCASSVKTGSKLRGCGGGRGGLYILSWKIPYTSYAFETERNIIVPTFFFLIKSETKFRLVYNQKEIICNHHVPFNLKRNKKYIFNRFVLRKTQFQNKPLRNIFF